jgi:adenylate cyclase
MVFFNDPVPIPDAAERAVKMAVAMREAASSLIAAWREGREWALALASTKVTQPWA